VQGRGRQSYRGRGKEWGEEKKRREKKGGKGRRGCRTPSLCKSVGNYKIEQYICGKYISKHHKHKTHNFYVENLPNVRRKNHGTVVHSNNSTINNNRNT
jgi:hypothetical protein